MSASTSIRRSKVLNVTATGEGEAYWFWGNLVVVRSPEGSLPVVLEMRLPAGSAAPLHVHERLEDNWYVRSGVIAVRDGDETALVHAGDYLTTRRGVAQTHFVLEGPAELLQLHANTDFLDYVKQFGEPATDRSRPPTEPLDMARAGEIAKATGQPVIGPPMTEAEARAIAQGR